MLRSWLTGYLRGGNSSESGEKLGARSSRGGQAGPRRHARRLGLTLEQLEARRVFVNHAIGDHIHPYLEIFVNGQEVPIPANIGLSTTAEFSPHTHDATGKLHIGEGLPAGIDQTQRYVTLKDFFDVWRTTNVGDATKNNPNANFDSTHLLGNTADSTHGVFMTVNGVPNTEYENYIPEDGDRIVLSYALSTGAPSLAPIANVGLLSGSPQYVSLDGFDPNGDQITWTVTANSNPSLVTTSIPTGNPFLQIQVDTFGSMMFELLQDKAPRPVERVVTLANQHFYDGLIFHRVMNNFVIQGGDPQGTGAGGSSLPNFDDQFNVDLQHNRTGLLSFAKSTDDTNNSQFFITEGSSRHLDFNHSIFGVLVEGEDVRDAISNVAVNSSSKPLTNVTMESVRVVDNKQDGVLLLKATPGATGSATLTVTGTDSHGNTTSRTFTVNVTADTANGGPFLNDIAPVRTTVNVPAVVNLTSQDVEGNAVTYTAVKADSNNSTVAVNATSGVVTVTPPAGFIGNLLVRATVAAASGQPNDTQDKSDIQTFSVAVAPTAPTGLDLPDLSDTGASVTDNVTKLTTPSITVNGVTSGATVKLYEGTTVVGQATATGTTVSITPTAALSAGAHVLNATQTVSGIESDASSTLTITIDTAGPTFTSTPPTTAKVNTAFSYDATTNDDGTAGFAYSLTGAPAGVTIAAATGVVSWTPTSAQLGAQSFQIIATDAAGNTSSQNVALTVSDSDLVQFRILITDTNGTALTSLLPNQSFQIRVLTRDIRSAPQGVFSAYLDVLYPSSLATVDGAITYGSQYPNVKAGTTSTAGLIDEAGAVAGFTSGDGSELLLLTIPMKATAAGTFAVTGETADVAPAHNVLVLGRNDPVPAGQIRFVGASATIGSALTAGNDTFNVNEDSAQTTLNVLANDTLAAGATGTITVTSVGTTNHGGTISIVSGGTGIRYQPAANFFGEETFTYVATVGSSTATATVAVQVAPVNDPPTGTADSFQVPKNSSNNILDVLLNDVFAPDASETLRVTAVSNVVGGTATLGPNGAYVQFTPTSGFTGNASFTYTLADPSNATATATATINVNGTNSSPTAANDTASVAEDSSNNTVNVLSNDSSAPDIGETLTVTAVGTPSQGGTVTVGSAGANVKYTPAENFAGTETFTYTISDGNGGTATATATMTVTNVNDPPVATNDTATVAEDSNATVINVLTNDSFAPDTGETLTVSTVTQGASGGTVTIGTGGANLSYKPAANFAGTDTFTYTISDGHGGTATGTVTVTVTNVNDNPVAVGDSLTVAEDSTANNLDVLANDSAGPDTGETLTITAVGATSSGGTATIGSGGTRIVYTPAANFKGSETFTYTISDGNGGTSTATATVSVTNTNDPPIAVTDSAVVSNTTPAVLTLLANDLAPDGALQLESLFIQSVTPTANGGTVTISADKKTVTYHAATGYTGPDSFNYTVADGEGAVSTATANINVGLFVPSKLGGSVFLDLNRDGTRQSNEPPIAGVTVTLVGPSGASSATVTKVTDASGAYQFTNLAPGSYTINQNQPAFLADGAESVGSQGGTVQNNTIVVNLTENTTGTNNNFAELRTAGQIRFRDFLARSNRDYALAAVDTTGKSLWTVGWSDMKLTNVTSASATNYKLDTVNGSSLPFSAQVPKTAPTIENLQSTNTGSLIRLNGASSSYSFTAVATGGSGEGELSPPATFAAATPTSSPTSNGVSTGAAVTSGLASSLSSARRASTTDAAIAQLTQGSAPRNNGFAAFSARRAAASASAVDRLMAQL